MLDIVITHYREDWKDGEKLFQSINLQRCIDFNQIRVMVVNDGGYRLSDECFDGLRYPVEQIDIPHGGVSAARNAGLDNANGKWIMFCDFDDCFASIYAISEILNVLPNNQFDMLWCRIIAEDYIEGHEKLYYVPDKQRFVFCHGKVYRRQFLIERNIRFDEELVFNEDSCFNAIIIARTHHTHIGEIKTSVPLYAWIRRQNSVTTSGREDEANYGHFRRNFKVTAEYENGDERYAGMVTRTVYDVYYMVFGNRCSPKMKRRMVDEFAPWISDRIGVYGKVDDATLDEIRQISKHELIDPWVDVDDRHQKVAEWVNGLVETYKKWGESNAS